MCMKVKVTQSCPALCNTVDCTSPWNSPGHNTGVGSHYLLQGIFPPRDRIQVSHNAGGFFTSWATREAPITCMYVCVCVCVCVCITYSLSIDLSMETEIDYMSWLLHIVRLWTLMCTYLFELEFSSFPNTCSAVRLLDHMAVLLLIF